MSTDWYQQLTSNPVGKQLTSTLGLPAPVRLRRYSPGDPVVHGPVLVGGEGRLRGPLKAVLENIDARTDVGPDEKVAALVFDATGITDSRQLDQLHDFFSSGIRRMDRSSRLLVLSTPATAVESPREAVAQRALHGFIRSVGKEMRGGATANLIEVEPGAEDGIASTLRFFLSGRSAFVSGQIVRLTATPEDPLVPADWDRPLDEQVAVVTGAAQGIGAAIAEVLARDGAHVVCVDIPPQGDKLAGVANDVGGSSFQLDITAEDAPRRLAEHVRERHGGVDIVVHNAGITRDKTLAGMDEERWNQVLDVNLSAQERLNDALLDDGVLHEHGRIISVSSLSGIAGNRGQTNYAASKAGIIGMVEALAPALAERRGTINAVAPGFIETAMTGEMPFAVREAGRRMNSLNQGGLPVDVAETIAWLANPASANVNGQVVRVCGQSLLGA